MSVAADVLHDCAREPIQFPGAIQPHGYLVSCVLPDWTIRHVSANVEALLDSPVDGLLGHSLREFITDDLLQAVADVVHLGEPGATPLRAAVGNIGPTAQLYDISVHVAEGLVHLEFESRAGQGTDRAPTAIAQAMIARAAVVPDALEFHQRAVEQMRQLTGHDRVLVYFFRSDGSGEVIAESRADDMPALMGLRFPESDIPAQARALYVRNRIRVIPDTAYVPVPVIPGETLPGHPLDLSLHGLRSVSPIHLEYSRNLGVAGSMSVSLVSGGRLWGLIACHHRTPLRVSATARAAAELFAMFVSMRVSAHEQQAIAARDEVARDVSETLWRRLASARDLDRALAGELDNFGRALECDGVALLLNGAWHVGGVAPERPTPALHSWLASHDAGTPGVVMTARAKAWTFSGTPEGGLAGVLAVRLATPGDWLLFFRVEQVEDVQWAGEPAKRVTGPPQEQKISPRQGFDAWREVIRGCSAGWTDHDRRMAERLRQLLHEFRRRALAVTDANALDELAGGRRRSSLREQRDRLTQLSLLLEDLVHLDEDETARLSDRIATLESELRALAAIQPRLAPIG